jgi:uncharacterized protein RhaS with RHS repeats
MTSAYADDNMISYSYRPDGLRYSKTSGDNTTIHLWDGQNIAADVDESYNVQANYLRGINLLASEDSAGNNVRYYLYNAHGDVVQLADDSGDAVWYYDYDAFGNEKEIAGQDPALDANPFRYCGEYFDRETGTIYLRARYYDPVTLPDVIRR